MHDKVKSLSDMLSLLPEILKFELEGLDKVIGGRRGRVRG